jgi:hypothetical protein
VARAVIFNRSTALLKYGDINVMSRCTKGFSDLMFVALVIMIAGCQSMVSPGGSTPFMVGPGGSQNNTAHTQTQKQYAYNSNINLDVVVPVFDPGLPKDSSGNLDYDKIKNDAIWPQLRRAESKKFAFSTKKAIQKIGAFGSVNVTPDSNVSSDVFVIGSIVESNSEIVKVKAVVMDSSGSVWGQKIFKHRVSEGFFRNSRNKNKDPYEPVFTQVADYVYTLLQRKNEVQKQAIRDLTTIRYAQYYSPESYDQYVQQKIVGNAFSGKRYEFKLTGKPSDADRMLGRIDALRNQDNMFIDRLQVQYEAFDLQSQESYRVWQKETLVEAVAARKAKNTRNAKAVLGIAAAIGAVMVAKNSNSTYAGSSTAALAVASVAAIGSSLKDNQQFKIHRASLDEMGESLDINLSPSVMQFNETTTTLTGTASEQHEQWKAHLKAIYDLEYSNQAL